MPDFLVIQAARFGDLVQTKRLLLTLAEKGAVHLALDRSLAPLAATLYPFASIHGLEFHGQPGQKAIRANRAAFAELREIGFDKVFNCNLSPLTAAMCRMFPAEAVAGNRPARDFDGGISRGPWPRLVSRLSGMRNSTPLNLVDFWAYFTDAPIAPERVNPGAKPGGGGLGIVVAGREARRSLPAPVLAAIAEVVFRLLKGPKIKLFGSAAEGPAAQRLTRHFSGQMLARTENLCGRTDLPGLCGHVRGLDLLLTPDTGIMHLAAHFGAPVMAFFLSSAWCHETGPYGAGHIVWQAAPGCAPCLESSPCPRNVACLAPYKDPAFGRSIAQALAGAPQPWQVPQGLQGWQTRLDDFGAFCHLAAGEDPLAARRANIRALIRGYSGLPAAVNPSNAPLGAYASLVAALFPDDEWALPPWRYV